MRSSAEFCIAYDVAPSLGDEYQLISEGMEIMDSLCNDPVATVLRRLFQEGKIADKPLVERYREEGHCP
jgi:hypothetical protein